MVERVTRRLSDEALLDEHDEEGVIPIGETKEDMIRAVLIGTFYLRRGDTRNSFKRGADTFPQIDRECYLIEAGNLERLMSLLAIETPENKRLILGSYILDPNSQSIADGDRFFQRHAAILGSTGSGKSWAVALLLERAQSLSYPNLIVLDMHGEYAPLATTSGGFAQRFSIAGPGDLGSPDPNVLFLPSWVLNREEMLSMLLDRSDQNAPNQANRFTFHVRNLKEEYLISNGLTETSKTFTVDSPIPYSLADLVSRLKYDDTERVAGSTAAGRAGDWNGRLTRFILRLESRVEDRRYGFLFQGPKETLEYDWLPKILTQLLDSSDGRPGIKVIDFSEVPPDVLPVVVGVLARLLYDVQLWMDPDSRAPLAFICDEAHLYMPVRDETDIVERRALGIFEGIAKQGRKHGISLVVISQRPSDVSRTILSQCSNFVVLRLTNDQDQSVVRSLMPDSMGGLVDVLPLMDIGEALILGDAVLLPSRIKLSEPQIKPSSATRAFWTEWNEKAPSVSAIKQAVETMRRQSRAIAD